MGLFDAQGELARLSQSLLSGLADRARGLGRFDRTQRLAAAHAVVVVTAYFDAVKELDLPLEGRVLAVGRAQAAGLATGHAPGGGRLASSAEQLLRAEVPMPAPHRPYERELVALEEFYRNLSDRLLEYVSGGEAWSALPEQDQAEVRAGLLDVAPQRALRAYEIMYRRLAAEFPEVAVWVNLIDHQATRDEVRRLHHALDDLGEAVARAAAGRVAAERYLALNRASRAAMDAPLLVLEDLPEGLAVPALGDGYISPDFKVAAFGAADRLSDERWWDARPVHHDLEGVLPGLFTAPQAVEAPFCCWDSRGRENRCSRASWQPGSPRMTSSWFGCRCPPYRPTQESRTRSKPRSVTPLGSACPGPRRRVQHRKHCLWYCSTASMNSSRPPA
ncbi:hypothetical protein [Streptomyces sp. NPDC002088]|uniref:NACHT N-terminal helical domain 7-containing protein n=1 Tax=Streptomyces sp. NPDC002088 TaxID=3154665 RepID=UPI0033172AEF